MHPKEMERTERTCSEGVVRAIDALQLDGALSMASLRAPASQRDAFGPPQNAFGPPQDALGQTGPPPDGEPASGLLPGVNATSVHA